MSKYTNRRRLNDTRLVTRGDVVGVVGGDRAGDEAVVIGAFLQDKLINSIDTFSLLFIDKGDVVSGFRRYQLVYVRDGFGNDHEITAVRMYRAENTRRAIAAGWPL